MKRLNAEILVHCINIPYLVVYILHIGA